jgi:two-component system sensor histidine kinase KdpD
MGIGVSIATRIFRIAASLGVVAGVVAVCLSIGHVRDAAVVLLLLLTILIIASRWDFWDAAAATALGAALLAYFFLPPEGWGIETVEHWLVFITFLVVALLASYFAARARRQTEEAVARRRELERLTTLGESLRIEGNPGSIVAACLDTLVRIFQVEAAASYDQSTGEITRSGSRASSISEDILREATRSLDLIRDRSTGAFCIPLQSGGQVFGSLWVSGDSVSELAFRAIAERIETGLEKVYAHEKVREAEQTKRNQELKTALLDSLVHEIKTPLSVIKTAASSLLSRDSDPASRRELLSIVNEEVDRMDASISEAFWAARVEAGALQSGKSPHDIGSLVREALSDLSPMIGDRDLRVIAPDALPPANCDSQMIKGVLKEFLTNALKYSPSEAPLTVTLRRSEAEIVTSVSDFGIGINPGEEEHVFERYYRGSVRPSGTGLGLAIAKTIVEAHGGRIGVERRHGAGSVFYFSLPVSHLDAA